MVAVDSYGQVVAQGHGRHVDCYCPMPCQGRFACRAPWHRSTTRLVPWCCGATGDDDDETNEWCDECSVRLHVEDGDAPALPAWSGEVAAFLLPLVFAEPP